jgi:SAM-dependent methyltransferase
VNKIAPAVRNLVHLLRPVDVRRHNRTALSRLLARYVKEGAVVYDIGCGNKPFSDVVRALKCVYVGVDVANGFYAEKPDIVGSATSVPVPDGTADIVLSSQVLEHLENPLDALREAHRILKPGGIFLCSFPFLYPIHAAPFDYGRYTRFFIVRAADRIGYEILAEQALAGYWNATAMAFAIYAQQFERGILKYMKLVSVVIALGQWFCVGMHNIERLLLILARREPDQFRQAWPVNYVFALGKRHGARSEEKLLQGRTS